MRVDNGERLVGQELQLAGLGVGNPSAQRPPSPRWPPGRRATRRPRRQRRAVRRRARRGLGWPPAATTTHVTVTSGNANALDQPDRANRSFTRRTNSWAVPEVVRGPEEPTAGNEQAPVNGPSGGALGRASGRWAPG